MMLKLPTLLPCLIFLALSCGSRTSDPETDPPAGKLTTMILVRHAEKAYGDDPTLTAEGTARAEKLAEKLSRTELDAVFSSDTKRTRSTAEPAAEFHGLEVQLYDVNNLEGLASRLRRRHRGETVLVVGHSNTTPALANLLAATDENARFSELDYGNLLVVTVPPTGLARVLKLRY